jgi:hypothetical protein
MTDVSDRDQTHDLADLTAASYHIHADAAN